MVGRIVCGAIRHKLIPTPQFGDTTDDIFFINKKKLGEFDRCETNQEKNLLFF